MSAILEAVREDIAEAEEQKVAIDERLKQLRAIETIALKMSGPQPKPARAADDAVEDTCSHCDRPAAQTYAGVRLCAEPSACRVRYGPPDTPEEPVPHRSRPRRVVGGGNAQQERDGEPDSEEERPARQHGPRSKITDDAIEAAARAVLPDGRVTPNAVCRQLGTSSMSVARRAQELFARWEGDGTIVPDRPQNGRPSFKLAPEAEPSPEPAAPASTTDDAGATLEGRAPVKHPPGRPAEARAAAELLAGAAASDSPASDEEPKEEVEDGLVDDDAAEAIVDEIEDYEQSGTRQRPVGQREFGLPPEWEDLGERIKALCENESRTTAALAEILGEDPTLVRKVTEKLARLNEVERRGWSREGSTEKPKYRIRPSLAEQGVTVKQADRSEDITVAIRRQLRVNGGQSIAALATQLVRHPRDIASGVQELLRSGEAVKHAGVPDARYELLEAG